MTTGSNEAALRWQALVDWGGGGVWGAAGVDISDDVLRRVDKWISSGVG